ncbi:MAG TPA: T9SS type A sorting domain-containing protein [Bacteroidia bacterium]|nr:T9SS type A sorting domain-containing protein [Bacteroidia bacterium]
MKKILLVLILSNLLNISNVYSCHFSLSYISGTPVDNGNGTYTITIHICLGLTENWGGTTHFDLTPVGGTFTNIVSFVPASLVSNYTFCDSMYYSMSPPVCVGNITSVMATAGGALNASQNILTYTQVSSVPVGCPIILACNGNMFPFIPDDNNAVNVNNNPDSLCWDITMTTNGYPFYISFTGAEHSIGPDTQMTAPFGCIEYDTLPQIPTYIPSVQTDNSDLFIVSNPVLNELTVQSSEFKVESIEIYNALGQQVYNSSLISQNSSLSIDVSQWHAGIYFVRARSDKEIITKKIVLSR